MGFQNLQSIQGLQGLHSIQLDLSNIGNYTFGDVLKVEHTVYKVIELKKDILALACCLYRLTLENFKEYKSCTVLDKRVENNLSEQDLRRSSELKDFYSKKMMMLTLKEKPLSSFRKDLIRLINSENFIYKEDLIKLAHKLPYFYEYDLQMKDLFSNTVAPKEKFINTTVNLKFHKKLNPARKGFNHYNYFFKDVNEIVYCLPISKDNNLLHLFEMYINKNEISIMGKFFNNTKDDYSYYNSADWKIVNENYCSR